MNCKVSDKLRKGSKVTLISSYCGIPKNTVGKVIQWTFERYWDGVYHTRHTVEFQIKNKFLTMSIPTKLLKK